MLSFTQFLNVVLLEKGNPLTVYHGSQHEFSQFKKPDDYEYMPDRALGIHVAKDPKLAATFTSSNYGQETKGSVYKMHAPPEHKFHTLHQPLQTDKTHPGYGKPENYDQTSFDKEIYKHAFTHKPEMFHRHLQSRWNMEPGEAKEHATKILNNEPTKLPTAHRHVKGIDDYIDYEGSPKPYDKEDKAEGVRMYRKHLQKQGFVGVKYQNTSPNETKDKPDPTCYVLFNHRHLKNSYSNEKM